MHTLSIKEISQNYERKLISPKELISTLISRVDKYDENYSSFIHLAREEALETASRVSDEMARGIRKGPLHGVPFAVKDNIDVKGYPTTCHSYASSKQTVQNDAAVISRLRAAGGIYMGKLALHEFAFGSPDFDGPYPPARNPWDIEYQPGGSSTGCGTAVAAGFVPLSVGTDTGGSIRNPAGFCGVVGMKPTYDLISRDGVFPLAFTLDHVGPLARTVEDIAISMSVLSDCDKQASLFGKQRKSDVHNIRIGFVRNFHETDVEGHPEVIAALNKVVQVYVGLGASVTDITLPPLTDFVDIQRIIIAAEAWAVHGQKMSEYPELYGQALREKAMVGGFLLASDYIKAQQQRRNLVKSVDALFSQFDVLLVANSFDPVCKIRDEAAIAKAYRRQARVPFSLTGHPALAQMCGFCSDGLPLSFQLVGPFYQDALLLDIALAYERATDWHEQLPKLQKY